MKPQARRGSAKAAAKPARRGRRAAVPPPSELDGLLDEVKATTIALLASLQHKEREFRARPAAGAARGLADIRALRRWGDRVLRTIQVLERGRSGEIESLLDELGEFRDILNEHQPPIPAEPGLVPPAGRP